MLLLKLLCDDCRLLGYEGLEVINPEGGTDDAEEEALRGRWKQEVRISELLLNSVLLWSHENKLYLKFKHCTNWEGILSGYSQSRGEIVFFSLHVWSEVG